MSGRCTIKSGRLAPWVPTGRRLVAVDIENVVSGSRASAAEVEQGVCAFRSLVGERDTDVWLWACGPRLAANAAKVVNTRLLVKAGVDGADRALLEQIDPAEVAGRFECLVLGSGDGRAFTDTVVHLAALGIPTDVIARLQCTSHELRKVARSFTPLSFAIAA